MKATAQKATEQMGLQTRAQRDMVTAERLVAAVASEPSAETKRIYGGLCHHFPVLVRTCGLCQALAFMKAKSTHKNGKASARSRAHELLLGHVGELLACEGDALDRVRTVDATQYMQDTRRILTCWIYFKRFAVSILNVEDGSTAREDSDGD
jgi:CRISPR-associated protein Cmr5